MNLAEVAAREAVLKTLLDKVNDQYKDARAEMQAALDGSGGVQQVAAMLPDGRPVAKISLSKPRSTAVVEDEQAYLEWVRDHHPAGEANITRRVEIVTEVQPAFTAALLAQLNATGTPEWCDPETGELHIVPGVAIRTADRTHSVRFEDGGRDAVMAAWRAGQLTAQMLPELAADQPE